MATVKYGSLVSEIKGSIGSTTFQRFGSNNGVRNKGYNNFSRSAFSESWRQTFNTLSGAWSLLTPGQKDVFVAVAPSYPAFNKYGVAFQLTGYQLYLQLNAMMVQCNLPLIITPVNWYDLGTPYCVIPSIVVPYSVCAVYWNSTMIADCFEVVYMSDMYPAASVNKNAKLKFIKAFDPSVEVSPLNIYSQFATKIHDSIVVGKEVFTEAWIVNKNNGISKKIYTDKVRTSL